MGRRTETDPKTGKPVVSSAGKFMGINTIYGRDHDLGQPYMTRLWIGRLRLHIFHRPDADEDCHDHPWDFWTFPIWPPQGYVEEVVRPFVAKMAALDGPYGYAEGVEPRSEKSRQIVPAMRLSFRPATHCHRVLGAYAPAGDLIIGKWDRETRDFDEGFTTPGIDPNRKLITIVLISKPKRPWGFLKNREGKWCWVAWRDYVFAGGKDGPCQ